LAQGDAIRLSRLERGSRPLPLAVVPVEQTERFMTGGEYILWTLGVAVLLSAMVWPLSARPSRLPRRARWEAWPPLL